MRIDSSGNISVNTANAAGYKFYVSGTGYFSDTITTGSNVVVAGNVVANGDVVAYNTSDKALKDNVVVIENALDKIDKVSGVHFTWNSEKQSCYTGEDVGVLAQEIEEVLPEAVVTRDDGYKAVRYEKIIPLLIQAIKELKQLNTK